MGHVTSPPCEQFASITVRVALSRIMQAGRLAACAATSSQVNTIGLQKQSGCEPSNAASNNKVPQLRWHARILSGKPHRCRHKGACRQKTHHALPSRQRQPRWCRLAKTKSMHATRGETVCATCTTPLAKQGQHNRGGTGTMCRRDERSVKLLRDAAPTRALGRAPAFDVIIKTWQSKRAQGAKEMAPKLQGG